ncbi:MAG: serine/threonine-protein phosphatase [Ruminococcus sp.]|nr:serine/threonine-protein phosphatase [Ruminococcus sp.]
MRLNISVSTNVGKRRLNNEDNFYADGKKFANVISDNFSASYEEDISEHGIFAVCDGMGGESFGEVASAAAVKVLGKYRDIINSASDAREQRDVINAYAKAANDRICDDVINSGGDRGGTTLTLACIRKNIIYMYYLGDSRIYMYRNGVLTRLTRDHTVAYRKVDSNVYTEEEAEKSPDRHKLTMFLGADESKAGEISAEFAGSYTLTPGDRFLLCTDGLTDMCSTSEITETLDSGEDDMAKRLVDRALANGGSDNVTCIVIQVKG